MHEGSTNMDLPELTKTLTHLLKLRSIPFGMKLFEDAADMEAIAAWL